MSAATTPSCRAGRTLWASFRRTGPAGRSAGWSAGRVVAALCLVAALWSVDLLHPSAAAADAARPTNFESVVDSVEPRVDGLRVDVVGGDSFLRVRAARGTEVTVPGYDGEPYLRIDADGAVWRNERSAATYVNQARDGGGADMPADVSSSAEPRWVQIGDAGEVAFHDHRIHWMIAARPTPRSDGVVQGWSVPMTVDDTDVVVSGRLLLHDDLTAWAIGLGLVAASTAAGACWLARDARRRPLLLGAAGAVALALAIAAHRVNPADAGAGVVPLALAAVALAAAALTAALGAFGESDSLPMLRHVALPLATVAALGGWVAGRVGVLWMPSLATVAPDWMDRLGTGLVLGAVAGVGAAILVRPLPTGGVDPTPPGAAPVASLHDL